MASAPARGPFHRAVAPSYEQYQAGQWYDRPAAVGFVGPIIDCGPQGLEQGVHVLRIFVFFGFRDFGGRLAIQP